MELPLPSAGVGGSVIISVVTSSDLIPLGPRGVRAGPRVTETYSGTGVLMIKRLAGVLMIKRLALSDGSRCHGATPEFTVFAVVGGPFMEESRSGRA
jgi:hypothetical protein